MDYATLLENRGLIKNREVWRFSLAFRMVRGVINWKLGVCIKCMSRLCNNS